MKKNSSIILLLAAMACLWTAGTRHQSLLKMRADYRLDSAEPLENAPPLMAFTTVVLGGFRGLIADILWLRTSYLQENGKYFELVQLSDWITKLEPRSTEIWAFHAWNMAYNVSAMMSEPEDRWRWIMKGVELLRDEGILYNSEDPKLYCELGWIFYHKIGADFDTANKYYERQWAAEMTTLFDGPRPDYDSIAASPDTVRRMRDEYKLIPDIMRKIDSKYGPLDWRLPESHALYWAYRGRQFGAGENVSLCDWIIKASLSSQD